MGEMPVTAAAAVPREASPHVFVAYRSYGTMVQSTDPSPYPHDWWSHLPNPLRQFGERVAQFFSPSAEAAATTESYEIALELPGVAEDDIHLEVRGDRLLVTGEKRARREESGRNYYFSERIYGQFRRTFRLPADADPDEAVAAHKDGVLTVTVPKLAPQQSESKRIPVGRG